MATLPAEELNEPEAVEETELERSTVSMLDAIAAPNLVPLLAEQDVSRIGSQAVQEYETDLESCKDFHERYDRSMEVAMQKKKAKTFPWPNASNVVYPLLTSAAIQFQARAYPAIIDGTDVVKGKVVGNDNGVPQADDAGQPVTQPNPETGTPEPVWRIAPGAKRERADRVAAHMTWQFLNDVPGWEEDTDKLLLQLPIIGCVFRKTWRDTLRNQNNSETITAKDFVVNYKTTSLDKAPRFTHVQRYYPHEIEAYIRSGEWTRVPYDGEDGSDPHSLVTILEQHRLIDMDDDGLPEPYVVTMTTDGAVARIAACYDAESIYVTSDQLGKQVTLAELEQAKIVPPDIRVVRIEAKQYFTKYGFIPAPDGSFYDIGFGTLTDELGRAVNTIINQLIDAGTLANMQGGFIAGGTKIRGGNMRFTPGEWKRVEGTTSGPLRDNILPLQLPGPNATLFQLLGMLIEAVQQITSVSDIITGNQETQTAPTTALALIEQGQKVFTAIYQRIHRALGHEIKIMFGLNRDYLDEEEYFALTDEPLQVTKDDYNDRDLDMVPVSDPRAINDNVKMAKAQVLMAHNGDPLVNQMEIRKREFEAAAIPDVEALLTVPPPPPDPAVLEGAARLKNERDKAKAEIRSKDATTALTLVQAATAAYQLGTLVQDPNIQAETQRLLTEAMMLTDSINQAMNEESDGGQSPVQPGGISELGGGPPDGGVPPVPEGLAGDALSGMGGEAGPIGADGAPAVPGGDAGGPGDPVM